MNERGSYGSQRLGSVPSSTIGAVAAEAKRAHTNAVLIGIGVLFGLVGYHNQNKPMGMISLGASGGMISSGIAGLLLDREGG